MPKKKQKLIPSDVVTEWLEENDYIKDDTWTTVDGDYFSFNEAVPKFAKRFKIWKSTAHNSIKAVLNELGLSTRQTMHYNRITQSWNDKKLEHCPTDFGKWFRINHGRRCDNIILYNKLWRQYKKGKLNI